MGTLPGGGLDIVTLRVMLYSQDGLGLGHLRRNRAIAGRLLAVYPEAELLMLADSPLAGWFPPLESSRLFSLPALVREGPNRWSSPDPNLSLAEAVARRRQLLDVAATSFAPHLVLVDHLPVGALGELRPILSALRERGASVVLGLRDILDRPEVVRQQWAFDGSFDAVNELYDAVLVYGERRLFDVAAAYGFSPRARALLRYCGYVCHPPGSAARPPERRRRSRVLLAVAGGGADAHPMLRATVDALRHLPRGWTGTVLTGPFMPEPLQADLQRRSHGLPLRVLRMSDDVPSLLSGADVIVTRAGYNTTAEACRAGVPTVLVPRPGPSHEQRLRARAFAAQGWVTAIEPEDADGERLAQAVMAAAARGRAQGADGRPPDGPDLGGLDVAVPALLDVARSARAVR
ncbi:MAG: hypothetical protein M3314_00550 [Actinomycetota bacterium]|nr:hypothetical protein [Actinomycetota bacterium]